tara:strand:- start:309 stop:1055 length:747 start_codon:yes stop_codon:yes gene_type:complete
MWDYFDNFYIITTDGSKFIKDCYNNLIATRIPKDKIIINSKPKVGKNNVLKNGCGPVCKAINKTHTEIIENAYKSGKKRIVIFEDDALFDKNIQTKLNNTINDLKKLDWDVFYFGHSSCVPIIPKTKNIVTANISVLAHAYAINFNNHNFVIDLINKLKNESLYCNTKSGGIDCTLEDIKVKKYAIFPQVNFQPWPQAWKERISFLTKITTFKNFLKLTERLLYLPIFILIIILFIIIIFRNKIFKHK